MDSSRKSNAASGWVSRLLATVAFLAAPLTAEAFKFSPIKVEFAPFGREANHAFLVESDSDQTVAVQITMLTRTMDIDGKEHLAPADDDFIVYPSQVLLKPKQVQTVRVQWVGDQKPKRELSYRILAEQLPIDVTADQQAGSRIKFVIRYLGAVYVVPSGALPDIVIDSVESADGEGGERRLAVSFHNRGTAHAILRDLELSLHAGGGTVTLGPDDLKGVGGENLLAETRRRFVIARPAELPEGGVSATFDYHRAR